MSVPRAGSSVAPPPSRAAAGSAVANKQSRAPKYVRSRACRVLGRQTGARPPRPRPAPIRVTLHLVEHFLLGRGSSQETMPTPPAHPATTRTYRRTPRSKLQATGAFGEPLRWCKACERHLPLPDFFDSSLQYNQYKCQKCVLEHTKKVSRRPATPDRGPCTPSAKASIRTGADTRCLSCLGQRYHNSKSIASTSDTRRRGCRSGPATHLSPSDVKQALQFWGYRCFATGLSGVPLDLVPVVEDPSSWREFVPIMRFVAKRAMNKLPPEPMLLTKWRNALPTLDDSAGAPHAGAVGQDSA